MIALGTNSMFDSISIHDDFGTNYLFSTYITKSMDMNRTIRGKLFPFGSALFLPSLEDSHVTGVESQKMFPSVSKITVSVLG
jgi:hypothetical protein